VRYIFVQQQNNWVLWRSYIEGTNIIFFAAPSQVYQQNFNNVVCYNSMLVKSVSQQMKFLFFLLSFQIIDHFVDIVYVEFGKAETKIDTMFEISSVFVSASFNSAWQTSC
jgi:hypothetical protein